MDAVLALLEEVDDLPDDLSPGREVPKILAAMIRDVGAPPVTEGEQAICYALSAFQEHRDAGDAWLEAHPDEAAALEGRDRPVSTVH